MCVQWQAAESAGSQAGPSLTYRLDYSCQQCTPDSSGGTAWQEHEVWLPIALLDCSLFLPERTHTLFKRRETGVSEVRRG